MGRLLWLPSVLRAAGLTVHEQPGWQTRGDADYDPYGIICHATAGSATSTDSGEINVLLHGSSTAPPPIAQLYLSRTGQWWVIASGRCNHALTGWAGSLRGYGNRRLIGIEAQNDNRGQPWPAVQWESYARGVAAILRHLGWGTARVAGHKEHQPSAKTDPTFDMGAFRARVQQHLAGEGGDDVDPKTEAALATMAGNFNGGMYYRGQKYSGHVILDVLSRDVDAVLSKMTGLESTVGSLRTALDALAGVVNAGGGDIDTAAVLARIDAKATEEVARDQGLRDKVAELEAELERRRQADAAAARAEADSLTDPPA